MKAFLLKALAIFVWGFVLFEITLIPLMQESMVVMGVIIFFITLGSAMRLTLYAWGD